MMPNKLLFEKGKLTEYFTQLKDIINSKTQADKSNSQRVCYDTSQQDI